MTWWERYCIHRLSQHGERIGTAVIRLDQASREPKSLSPPTNLSHTNRCRIFLPSFSFCYLPILYRPFARFIVSRLQFSVCPSLADYGPLYFPSTPSRHCYHDLSRRIMLTRSPVISNSANASPSSFHYAPVARSSHSSPRIPPPPRRQSARSGSSPRTIAASQPSVHTSEPRKQSSQSPSVARKYVCVDVGTQYSPMEPFNYSAPRPAPLTPAPPQSAPSSPALGAASPGEAIPMAQEIMLSGPSESCATLAAPSPAEGSAAAPKRRNSLIDSGAKTPLSGASQRHVNMPKRPKAAGDPKVLPLRYELARGEDIVELVANMLNELIRTNDGLALTSGSLTRFHSR